MFRVSLELGEGALDRILRVASDSDAPMVYADHYDLIDGKRIPHPVIDYQVGSVRDDFDFGSLLLIKTSLLHTFAMQAGESDYHHAGLYALRLFLSRNGQIFHIDEKLSIHTGLLQPCPALCDAVDCGLPGFSVRGVLQARILEHIGQYWLPYPSRALYFLLP